MPPVPTFSLFRLAVCALSVSVLTACPAQVSWDREYVCNGLERSTTHVRAPTETKTFEKTYPIAIDLHLRTGSALVKSHQVVLQSQAASAWTFHSKSPASWASGSFNDQSGALSLIESQVLYVDGVAQEVRTTGQYTCVGSGTRKPL